MRLILALSLLAAIAAAPTAESRKIDRLIAAVASSGALFIRNGSEFPAAEAAAHLRMKLGKAGDRVRTAADFIAVVATASYLSGKPYLMRFPDGRVIPAGQWLKERLAEIEAQNRQ